jgi:hypothetical protein
MLTPPVGKALPLACDFYIFWPDERFPLVPEATARDRSLVGNPCRLYGFPTTTH